MKEQLRRSTDPRVRAAVGALQSVIRGRNSAATFELSHGEGDDLEGWYLTATVDIPDTDDVMDLVVDRLLYYQIDEELPVYVIPVQPLERVAEQLQARREHRSVAHRSLTS